MVSISTDIDTDTAVRNIVGFLRVVNEGYMLGEVGRKSSVAVRVCLCPPEVCYYSMRS